MQLTLFSDYSLRLLMYLGLKPDRVVPIVEIADAFKVSRHYMLKVMNALVQLGYLEAVRGRNGGVRMLQRPEDVRLGKLVMRTEPSGGVLACLDGETDCPIISVCRLRRVLADAQAEFYRAIDRYTLADLIAQPTVLGEHLLRRVSA
jgi:Rrf2 family transcriptional regulator, nitric oxide-sensitive transcriptional repressor